MYFPTVRIVDDIASDIDRFFDHDWNKRSFYKQRSSPFRVTSDADSCVISIDLPGVSKDDIAAQVEGNILEVSGKRGTREFHYRHSIDKRYDTSTVTAKHKDGVLAFSFRVHESQKPRKIIIE